MSVTLTCMPKLIPTSIVSAAAKSIFAPIGRVCAKRRPTSTDTFARIDSGAECTSGKPLPGEREKERGGRGGKNDASLLQVTIDDRQNVRS